MGTFWEDVKKTVKEGLTVAVEKTEEVGKIGKVKIEILKLEKDRDKVLRDLGTEMHSLIKKNKSLAATQSDKVKKMITKIDNLKKSLKAKENEIEKIKKDAESKSQANKTSGKPAADSKSAPPVKKTAAKSTKKKA